MSKRNERKKKLPLPRGTPRLDSVFSSGHDRVFVAGMAGIAPGGESKEEKEKPPMPVPWPGEGTIIMTKKSRGRRARAKS